MKMLMIGLLLLAGCGTRAPTLDAEASCDVGLALLSLCGDRCAPVYDVAKVACLHLTQTAGAVGPIVCEVAARRLPEAPTPNVVQPPTNAPASIPPRFPQAPASEPPSPPDAGAPFDLDAGVADAS